MEGQQRMEAMKKAPNEGKLVNYISSASAVFSLSHRAIKTALLSHETDSTSCIIPHEFSRRENNFPLFPSVAAMERWISEVSLQPDAAQRFGNDVFTEGSHQIELASRQIWENSGKKVSRWIYCTFFSRSYASPRIPTCIYSIRYWFCNQVAPPNHRPRIFYCS